jgi:hypothetical protein
MSKGAPKEIHNLNCLSLSVLATRRHKFSMGKKNHQFCSTGKHQNHSFIGRMKTDYKPNLFTITKHELLSSLDIKHSSVCKYLVQNRGCRGRDRMVVGFTTTCVISANHH